MHSPRWSRAPSRNTPGPAMCAAWRPIASAAVLSPTCRWSRSAPTLTSVWVRNPVEIVLTDRQERSLLDAGLMPLSAVPYSEELVFGAVRSLQVPQRYQGANAERRRCQRAAFHADQLDPVRVALRASSEDEGPSHGRLVQDRGRDRALPAGLADAVRQRQSIGGRRQSGRASRWSPAGSRSAKCPANRAASAA